MNVNAQLTPDEQALLAELLDRAYRDLKVEIANTEDFHYKEDLKAREQRLLSILGKFGVHLA
jgi:hypothetical protein